MSERSYRLPHAIATACMPGTWRRIQQAPAPRVEHVAFWTGSEMLVWGGKYESADIGEQTLAEGGLYDPSTDTWRPIDGAAPGAPVPRRWSSAVWTGTELIVWGGEGDTVGTGARFNPTTDAWSPIPASPGSPTGRYGHVAAWTGSAMILWGGSGWDEETGPIVHRDGARFDPLSGTWGPMAEGGPALGDRPLTAWTGSQFLVWNGPRGESGRYDPAADAWGSMSVENGPEAWGASAVWSGELFIVWGGDGGDTGARYDPVSDTWSPTSTTGAPFGRYDHTAVWTGTEMIVWGGSDYRGYSITGGGRYDPHTDSWILTARNGQRATRRAAVWTGTEMIVWGGNELYRERRNRSFGERYDPASDSLVPTFDDPLPDPAFDLLSVWTGSEMLMWTSSPYEYQTPGWRFDPATTTWSRMTYPEAGYSQLGGGSTVTWSGREVIVFGGGNSPDARNASFAQRYDPQSDTWRPFGETIPWRSAPTATWTGTEMVFWGGMTCYPLYPDFCFAAPTASGIRWIPDTDEWSETSLDGAPAPRVGHTAVWTGTEMIVWGGDEFPEPAMNPYGSGGRYNPATDSWTPVEVSETTPFFRRGHAAFWTGSEMVVWGGTVPYDYERVEGGRYDPASGTWTPLEFPGAWRYNYGTVWTGSQLLMLAGFDPSPDPELGGFIRTGESWDLASNSWSHIAATPYAPLGGMLVPVVAWTGSEAFVLGRSSSFHPTVGGLYCPAIAGANRPPLAEAGPDQVLECTAHNEAPAHLDGSLSTDPNGVADIASYAWTENGGTLATGVAADVDRALGEHTITLTVTDNAGASNDDTTHVTVQDTTPPTGGITAPIANACFGSSALPVVIEDDLVDACSERVDRAYEPAGPYGTHGDYHVTLTGTDPSGNATVASVDFTIDTVAPAVVITAGPGQLRLPMTMPFANLFRSADDDGAKGGVVHEWVTLDGCAIADGATYGNADGLLADELLVLDQASLCRMASACGVMEWNNPPLTVWAADCGGNVSAAQTVLRGRFHAAMACVSATAKPRLGAKY